MERAPSSFLAWLGYLLLLAAATTLADASSTGHAESFVVREDLATPHKNVSYNPFAQNYNNSDPRNSILRENNSTFGPAVEEVHYFYNYWPIGLAISSSGRIFTCYTRGSYDYTLGVVVNKTSEQAYPPSGPVQNLPVDQLNTTFNGIQFGSSNKSGIISVQALYITPETSGRPETLWVVDTGRPTIHNAQGDPTIVYAQPGGPKVIAISLKNDSVYATYTFPADVHYPDSYFNDIRLDLRPKATNSSQGIAYLVDSSNEGRPGFIMLDLATGESWRRLTQDPSVLRVPNNVPSYNSKPFYLRSLGMPIGWQQEGLDGIQLSPDGKRLYYSPLTSSHIYSIPTVNLRARDTDVLAELAARSNVSDYGERGTNGANGFEGDNQGRIYQLLPTENSVYYFDPRDLQTHAYVTDPRIVWPDSASIGFDGYFYMNINQLPFQPDWNYGVDGRTFPGAILRFKLPTGANKLTSLA